MLQVQDLSKWYRSGRGRLDAIADVSCDAGPGEALAVVGKSGSGKTTLLHCVGGLERPDGGTVHCFGKDLCGMSRRVLSLFQRRHVGFVFQFGNLLSHLTVFENVAFPLALNGVFGAERDTRVRELLERVGLGGAGAALPRELSGGEIQRVSLARAVIHGPRLLLADEPTASLDTQTGAEVVDLMLGLVHDQGCTLVVSTHDPVVIRRCDRILHLRDGRVVAEAEYLEL